MLYGIGTDLCDVRRVRGVVERHGEHFARKILSEAELAVWKARSQRHEERGLRFLASRFSAKESFSKAIGLGMHWPMAWRACEIANRPGGQPHVVLHGALRDWFEERSLVAHISLSDDGNYASSFCVIERRDARTL